MTFCFLKIDRPRWTISIQHLCERLFVYSQSHQCRANELSMLFWGQDTSFAHTRWRGLFGLIHTCSMWQGSCLCQMCSHIKAAPVTWFKACVHNSPYNCACCISLTIFIAGNWAFECSLLENVLYNLSFTLTYHQKWSDSICFHKEWRKKRSLHQVAGDNAALYTELDLVAAGTSTTSCMCQRTTHTSDNAHGPTENESMHLDHSPISSWLWH